jgi:hypothetical protein
MTAGEIAAIKDYYGGDPAAAGARDIGVAAQSDLDRRMGIDRLEGIKSAITWGGVPTALEALSLGAPALATLPALAIGTTALAPAMTIDKAIGQELATQEVEGLSREYGIDVMDVGDLAGITGVETSGVTRGLQSLYGGIKGLLGFDAAPSELESAVAGQREALDYAAAGTDLGALAQVDPTMATRLGGMFQGTNISTGVERLGVPSTDEMAMGRRYGRADQDPYGFGKPGPVDPGVKAAGAANVAAVKSAVSSAWGGLRSVFGGLFGRGRGDGRGSLGPTKGQYGQMAGKEGASYGSMSGGRRGGYGDRHGYGGTDK